MAVLLQAYIPSDFEALYAIDRACYPRGIAYSRNTLKEFLTLPGADCLVARESALFPPPVVGFIVTESTGSRAHIITLDVVEAFRRTGVGSALLHAVEERMAAREIKRIELETATANVPGVAFWKRHGYREIGILRGYYLGRLDAWKMSKTLAPPSTAQHL